MNGRAAKACRRFARANCDPRQTRFFRREGSLRRHPLAYRRVLRAVKRVYYSNPEGRERFLRRWG